MRKEKNKLSHLSYKYHAVLDHPVHEQHRAFRNHYGTEILSAKKEHWVAFLEGISFSNIWHANRYISAGGSDGGKTRIPTLKLYSLMDPTAPAAEATTNEEKSEMLASLMFQGTRLLALSQSTSHTTLSCLCLPRLQQSRSRVTLRG